MIRFFATRLLLLLPTFAGVTLVAFAFIHLIPGDPIEVMVGERALSPERHAEMMARLGLDRPLSTQYLSYVLDLFRGDLGHSLVTRRPVLEEFLTLFPATLELSLAAILLAVGVGLPVGMLAAVRRGSVFDHAAMTAALTGYSMPIFWWGLLLIILFSGTLGWTRFRGGSTCSISSNR